MRIRATENFVFVPVHPLDSIVRLDLDSVAESAQGRGYTFFRAVHVCKYTYVHVIAEKRTFRALSPSERVFERGKLIKQRVGSKR